jgi:hypothetical protein
MRTIQLSDHEHALLTVNVIDGAALIIQGKGYDPDDCRACLLSQAELLLHLARDRLAPHMEDDAEDFQCVIGGLLQDIEDQRARGRSTEPTLRLVHSGCHASETQVQ